MSETTPMVREHLTLATFDELVGELKDRCEEIIIYAGREVRGQPHWDLRTRGEMFRLRSIAELRILGELEQFIEEAEIGQEEQ